MKKRWLSLYVENEVGVLARIAGLFSAKSYNLNSLTVGTTEDETVSRMTIGLTSDDKIFEQVKKQLNACIEVIKVLDITSAKAIINEHMLIKIFDCAKEPLADILSDNIKIIAITNEYIILQCLQTEAENTALINRLQEMQIASIEVVRGGSIGIEC